MGRPSAAQTRFPEDRHSDRIADCELAERHARLTFHSALYTFNQMIERSAQLDLVFGSLADTTRRDILRRVAGRELSVGEIASSYDISLAAVSKHLIVLENARLVTKRREGKLQIVGFSPAALTGAVKHLQRYREVWESSLDKLERYLKEHP
jgi:DNA-binding transcriptional ArsR family regulator